LSCPIFELVIQHRLGVICSDLQVPLQCYDLAGPQAIRLKVFMVTLGDNVSPHIQHGFWLRGVQP